MANKEIAVEKTRRPAQNRSLTNFLRFFVYGCGSVLIFFSVVMGRSSSIIDIDYVSHFANNAMFSIETCHGFRLERGI